jgi:aspartate aminotransferase
VLDAGDEVIVPAPYWVSYPDMALLADATPVILSAPVEQGFKLAPEQLEAAITPKTRLLLLNSPSNPTGVAYTPEELKALGEILLRHPRVLAVSDDIYEHILWAHDRFSNILNACPGLYERCILINGVSKAYAMTGWRIGYAAGPMEIVRAMTKVQSQSTSNPTSIAQVAAQAALEGGTECIAPMRDAFKRRHDFVLEQLNLIDGVHCLPADGTFYAFPDMRGLIRRLDGVEDDVQLAEFLMERVNVALVPGTAFGAPGHLRLSFATSDANLTTALERISSIRG